MKICIVIQSHAFRTSAGMRIRYDRFAKHLPDGVTIDAITTVDLLSTKSLDHDVYIFCKTFDGQALLIARRAQAEGKAVGQDVFDDYFSQASDPRLQKYRDWMRDMAAFTDFAICTTERIAEVLRHYLPDVPITPIEDPMIDFDAEHIGSRADLKVSAARDSGVIGIVWFGIGDNPFFRVGLADLVACEPHLAVLERLGWRCNLTILTNRRAFESGGAEALRTFGTSFTLVEWTEEAEALALNSATVAILPVNGQSFSRAKSLNRAFTALTSGCQVLTLGYPLYERFSAFVYRSAETLSADIKRGRCRVGAETSDGLRARMWAVGNPHEAAARFAVEARRAVKAARRRQAGRQITCLVHGRASDIALHKAVTRLGGLSIGTIFANSSWNFPVRFDHDEGEVRMRITPALAQRFDLPVIKDTTVRIVDLDLVYVDLNALGIASLVLAAVPSSPAEDAMFSRSVFDFAERCCRTTFPDADVLISEASPLMTRPRPVSPPRRPTGDRGAGSAIGALIRPRAPAARVFTRIAQRFAGDSVQSGAYDVSLIADSAFFDGDWYLQTYADVAVSNIDPARHYLECGWLESRDPGPDFSTKLYLKHNPDVLDQGMNPLLHYVRFGQEECRKVSRSLVREPAAR